MSLQIITIQIIGLFLITVTLVNSECHMDISHIRYYGTPDNEYEMELLLRGRKKIESMTCKNMTFNEEPLFSVLLDNKNNSIHKYNEIDKKILSSMQDIWLVNTSITLNSRTFQNFPNLSTLNIISSNLSTFDITPISSVRNLDLSHNSLTSLNNTNFQGFELLTLNAGYNRLLNIYCSNVSKVINFSHNQLNYACKFSPSIENINLSHNNISYIRDIDFSDLKKLTKLDLSYNKIVYISYHLEGSKSIQFLNLSHNNIKYLFNYGFDGIESMISIDLSYNRIEKLGHGDTNNLENLLFFDLSYNNIYDIDIAAVFYPIQHLIKLKLEGNLLRELDVKTLNHLLKDLEFISLSFSQISCNKLMDYIREFKNNNVKVLKGPVVYEHNVHGILCTPINNTNLFRDNFEYALYSIEKVHTLFIVIALFFIIILLMLIVINYYRYKNMRRF